MAAKSKSFKDQMNPAMKFISQPQPEEQGAPQQSKASAAPEGYKLNPLYVETKSRRLQLLVQPSLHEKIKARASASGRSVNEYIHSLLEEAMKEDE